MILCRYRFTVLFNSRTVVPYGKHYLSHRDLRLPSFAITSESHKCSHEYHTLKTHALIPLCYQQKRNLTSFGITKNLELISNSSKIQSVDEKNPLQITTSGQLEEGRPLAVILSWLMSQRKHLLKYAHFYLSQGFDVLLLRATPWQLLFPQQGTQIIARDLLTFMTGNKQYHSILLHGFSVGGYMFGEVLALMEKNPKIYQDTIDRIVGQIWDSVVDFEGIPTGLPQAVFPKNAVLRSSLETYVRYHLMALKEIATKHYHKSSACYHNTIVRAPALFLCSLDDPVGSKEGIQRVIDNWEALGMQVYLKCWDTSRHASHLHHHPEEYIAEMKAFLDKVGLLPYPDRFLQEQASQRQ